MGNYDIEDSKLSTLFDADKIKNDEKELKLFKDKLINSCSTPIPTGFKTLDDKLNGGLVPSLYVIGAMPSLGKSTFMLNVAENIARLDIPVIYFSLEMSREYIARMTLCHCVMDKKYKDGFANIEAKDISPTLYDFQRREGLNKVKLDKDIIDDYLDITEKIYIIERNADMAEITVNIISEAVEKIDEIEYGKDGQKNKDEALGKNQMPKFVLFVDYLQLLCSNAQIVSERSNVDRNITALWSIANRFKIPVIVISSINRDAYGKNIDLSSFKESGGIEFSADVIFGLQYTGSDKKGFDINSARQQNPRKLNLKIIKNRYGSSGDTINLDFYPRVALFKENTESTKKDITADAVQEKTADAVQDKTIRQFVIPYRF